MSVDLNRFKLSDDLHNEIFKDIESYYLPKSVAQDNPLAIITGGQPGSGKSGITADAQVMLSKRGGYVLLDADKLRNHHPYYPMLRLVDDKLAADYTHYDAGQWAIKLKNSALNDKRNLIVDQTSRDPLAVDRLTKSLHENGYSIEFWALAVNKRISEQRIYTRYENQKAADGYGRFSTIESHNSAYSGLLESVKTIEQNRNVDAIYLYDKDIKPFYSNHLKGQGWPVQQKASDALVAERERPLTFDEKLDLANGYGNLSALIKERDQNEKGNVSLDELKNIERLRLTSKWELASDVFNQKTPNFDALLKSKALKSYPELKNDFAVYQKAAKHFERLVPVNKSEQARLLKEVFARIQTRREPSIKDFHQPGKTKDKNVTAARNINPISKDNKGSDRER